MNFDFKSNWRLIKSRDLSAFKELYYNTCHSLIQYSFHIIHDQQLAEEIVHDVFVNIWNNIEKIELSGSVKAYLYQAVHNYSINKIRHQKIARNAMQILVSDEAWLTLEELYCTNDYTIEKLEAMETEAQIFKILKEIPDQCREIFLLSRIENLSNKEIAEKLNISVSAVKTQIYRALEKIRIELFKKP